MYRHNATIVLSQVLSSSSATFSFCYPYPMHTYEAALVYSSFHADAIRKLTKNTKKTKADELIHRERPPKNCA